MHNTYIIPYIPTANGFRLYAAVPLGPPSSRGEGGDARRGGVPQPRGRRPPTKSPF